MNQDTANVICRFLNQYIFDKVWNEPYKEYRRNIVPISMTPSQIRGHWSYRSESAMMPDSTKSYYVYGIDRGTFGNIRINTGSTTEPPACVETSTWVSLTEYLNSSNLVLRVHGEHGEMLYRSKIYIRDAKDPRLLLMAIERKMFSDILGRTYNHKNIYIAIYFDSDNVDDIIIHDYYPSTQQELIIAANACINADVVKSTIFVNGRVCTITSVTDIKIGDYIEIVEDDNIRCVFELDLSQDLQNRQYQSQVTNTLNQIIHIPKEHNVNNEIISHNTCDVYMTPRNTPNRRMEGLFVHRANPASPFVQLTHNDFAFPETIIDSYKNKLGTDEVVLTTKIRTHRKNNVLSRDASYIDLLYIHDDKTINDFLEDNGPIDFHFWSARELEISEYIKAIMHPIAIKIHPENMDKYINALGAMNVLSLISNRVKRFIISDIQDRVFVFGLPVVFTAVTVFPSVYLRGLKVPSELVTVSQSSIGCITVILHESITLNTGDDLVIELFENNPNPTYKFIPVLDNTTIVVNLPAPKIYEKITLSEPIYGVDKISTTSYRPVNIEQFCTVTEVVGGLSIECHPQLYGKELIIEGEEGLYRIYGNVQQQLNDKNNITVDLMTQLVDSEELVPIIGPARLVVHLNNKLLIENLDYKIVRLVDIENSQAIYQVVIQNMSYLVSNDNMVEIFIIKEKMIGPDYGFVINNDAIGAGRMPVWIDNGSVLHVDGYMIKDVELSAGRLIIHNATYRNGAPYGVRTVLPKVAIEYMNDFPVDNDLNRFLQIQEYLYGLPEYDENMVVVEHSHHIYSTFVCTVVRDVLLGTKVLTYEPDDDKVLDQVSEYIYLKQLDIVYQHRPDLRYVDVFPIYQQLQISNPDTFRNLMRFISVALPKDTIIDGSTV